MKRKKKTRKEKVAEHLQKLKQEEEKVAEPKGILSTIYSLLIVGIIIFVYCHSLLLYNYTIIEFKQLFGVSLFLTLILFIYLGLYFEFFSDFFDELLVVFYLGAIICFLFSRVILYINYVSFDHSVSTYTTKIIEHKMVKRKRGQRYPAATFIYKDIRKTLNFRSKETHRVYEADSLIMDIRKGNLGFGIIQRYDVLHSTRKWH